MTDYSADMDWFKKRKQIVFLEISTFRGSCYGAVHYYGYLTNDSSTKRVELNRTLTHVQALELTKLHNNNSSFGRDYVYEEGDEVSSFDSIDDIENYATKVWREHFPDMNMLVVGTPVYVEYERILDGELK